MKPVTGNITGYRLTGNRLTTLVLIYYRFNILRYGAAIQKKKKKKHQQ